MKFSFLKWCITRLYCMKPMMWGRTIQSLGCLNMRGRNKRVKFTHLNLLAHHNCVLNAERSPIALQCASHYNVWSNLNIWVFSNYYSLFINIMLFEYTNMSMNRWLLPDLSVFKMTACILDTRSINMITTNDNTPITQTHTHMYIHIRTWEYIAI